MNVSVKPKYIVGTCAGLVSLLTVAHCTVMYFFFWLDHRTLLGLRVMFDLLEEGNVPTFYAATALLLCGLLLGLIWAVKKHDKDRYAFHWGLLALVFTFMAFDEAASIHELLMAPLRNIFSLSGIFFFAWVIPYGLLLIVLGILYLKFLFNLPACFRNLFIVSGAIFVSGALGVELFEGRSFEMRGQEYDLVVYIYITVEEVLEMLGILLFIYSLLSYIDRELKGLRICISSGGADDNIVKQT